MNQRICPKCGRPKSPLAKQCYDCYMADKKFSLSSHPKDECPQCGRPKLVTSNQCVSCTKGRDVPIKTPRVREKGIAADINWGLLTEDWLNQFIGIWLGEGSVGFHRSKLSNGRSGITIRVSMQLRADDYDTIADIHEKLGGSVSVNTRQGKPDANPTIKWDLSAQHQVERFLRLVRPRILLPMRKVKEVDLGLEFIEWRLQFHQHELDQNVLDDFYNRMQALRVFVMPDL